VCRCAGRSSRLIRSLGVSVDPSIPQTHCMQNDRRNALDRPTRRLDRPRRARPIDATRARPTGTHSAHTRPIDALARPLVDRPTRSTERRDALNQPTKDTHMKMLALWRGGGGDAYNHRYRCVGLPVCRWVCRCAGRSSRLIRWVCRSIHRSPRPIASRRECIKLGRVGRIVCVWASAAQCQPNTECC
jgi:hypothetical protein